MATRPNKPDLSATVVLDSNTLFTENDVEIVNKEFSDQVEELANFGANFVIPRIVLRELLFRKLFLLKRFETDVRRGTLTIGKLTTCSLPSFPSIFCLSLRLLRRWKKWCQDNKITIAKLSHAEVNWQRLVSASIHRRAPFSPFDPSGKSEKGFRDSLVLETLKQIYINGGGKKVVFICHDNLLRETSKKHFTNKKFESYSTTAEYLSYLRLENKSFFNSLITFIIEEGAKLFYSKDDSNCIYNHHNLPAQIQTIYASELARKPAPNSLVLGALFSSPATYSDVTSDGIQLGETNVRGFVSETKTLSFTSSLKLAKAIQSSNQWEQEQVRIAEFKVDWTCIWDGQSLTNPKQLEKIHIGEITFEASTDILLASFNLPTKLQRSWPTAPVPQQQAKS